MIGDDKDARAFDPRAGAVDALIDDGDDYQIVPQHYERPRLKRSACGVAGQTVWLKSAVTCPACKTYLASKDER